MAELLRVVTLSRGGRPVAVFDLASGDGYMMGRSTFAIEPGERESVTVRQGGRYGGERPVAERASNARAVGTWYVEGSTASEAISNVRALVNELESAAPGRFIEWRPDGAEHSVLLERRGPAAYKPTYRRAWFRTRRLLGFEVSFPVAPVGRGLAMDVLDADFSHLTGYYEDLDAALAAQARAFEPIVNLVTNPRFADDLAEWRENSAPTRVTTWGRFPGNYSQRWDKTGFGAAAFLDGTVTAQVDGAWTVEAGETYTLQVPYNLASSNGWLRFELVYRLADGTTPWAAFDSFTITALGVGQVALTAQVPVGAVGASLDIWSEGATAFDLMISSLVLSKSPGPVEIVDGSRPGCVWDGAADASTSRQVAKVNRVPNPSGEVDASGWRVGGIASLAPDGAWAAAGEYSLRYAGTKDALLFFGGSDYATLSDLAWEVTGGVEYAIQIAYKNEGLAAAADFTFTGPTGAPLASSARVDLPPGEGVAVLSGIAPAGATNGHLGFYQGAATGAVDLRFDAVQMIAEPSPSAYFDGDTPGCEWSGTEHGSSSVAFRMPTGEYRIERGLRTLQPGVELAPTSLDAKRLHHVARGYRYGDNQTTLKFRTGASAAGYAEAQLHRLDAANCLLVRQEQANLRVCKLDNGVETQLDTVASALAANTDYWLRGRIEGSVVTAELFTSEPTPRGTPAVTKTYTLAGADATKFGSGVEGESGFGFQPAGLDWRIKELRIEPFSYRSVVAPERVVLDGTVPGDVDALVDVALTHSGGVKPIWAVIGHTRRPAAGIGGSPAPFGILEAESATDLAGWTSQAEATARGGNMLKDSTVSGAEFYVAQWMVDPSVLTDADAFRPGEWVLELWARVRVASTLVSPRLAASTRPAAGAEFGSPSYTPEFGSIGRALVVPSTGTVWRFTRLGTLCLPSEPTRPQRQIVRVDGQTAPASSGIFGLDYLLCVGAHARAVGATGKVADATYPEFLRGTSQATKEILHDGRALISSPPNAPHPDHGLGGAAPRLSPGANDFALKLSSLVPDDPTINATDEAASHTVALHLAVTPRYSLLAD